jgi:hypothetical protein
MAAARCTPVAVDQHLDRWKDENELKLLKKRLAFVVDSGLGVSAMTTTAEARGEESVHFVAREAFPRV